jgi:hypothetical protein
VATALTEPLGLLWALPSVGFFIEAFRTGSVKPALVAFAMTIVALMARMGSVFTIPALLFWLVWHFGHGIAAKLRIGVVSIGILLGVLGVNSLLQKAYGTSEGSSSSIFGYVLCGLTIGTTLGWMSRELAAEGEPLRGDEATVARQLYAWPGRISAPQPEIFQTASRRCRSIVSQFPVVIWRGYGVAIDEPDWLFRNVLTAISLIGFPYIAARRANSVELTFWALLWVSIVVSSSLVYFDDGTRTLAAIPDCRSPTRPWSLAAAGCRASC